MKIVGWVVLILTNNLFKMITKKEKAEKLSLNFDEVKDIFSEETLSAIEKAEIKGGEPSFPQCTCQNNDCDCIAQESVCQEYSYS